MTYDQLSAEIEKLLVKEPVTDDSDLTEEDTENKEENPKEEEKVPPMGGGDGETPIVPKG